MAEAQDRIKAGWPASLGVALRTGLPFSIVLASGKSVTAPGGFVGAVTGNSTTATNLSGQAVAATFVIAAEAADMKAVAVTVKDSTGAAIAYQAVLHAYLSDSSTGVGVTATAPDGGVAAGAAGKVQAIVTGKVLLVETSSTGVLNLEITEAAGGTWYLVLVVAGGKKLVSGAITFAA